MPFSEKLKVWLAKRETVNLAALYAVGLALILGSIGTLLFSVGNHNRIVNEEQSAKKVEELVGRVNSLMATVSERLDKIEYDMQQLRTGQARDARVGDLISKHDALAASIDQQAKELGDHQKRIALITKKLRL